MTFRGIPLRIQPSWLFALAIFTMLFQGRYASELTPAVPLSVSWGLGLATALLLFLSVLLHELGHAVMAVREGVKVLSITLFHLGGIARVEKECTTAMGGLRIAPAVPSSAHWPSVCCFQRCRPLVGSVLTLLCTQLGLLNLMLGCSTCCRVCRWMGD